MEAAKAKKAIPRKVLNKELALIPITGVRGAAAVWF
jgi:hypothetical protein